MRRRSGFVDNAPGRPKDKVCDKERDVSMSALAAPRPLTQETLEAHRKAHEELVKKLQAHGVTYEQLCEEALEIVRETRERRHSARGH